MINKYERNYKTESKVLYILKYQLPVLYFKSKCKMNKKGDTSSLKMYWQYFWNCCEDIKLNVGYQSIPCTRLQCRTRGQQRFIVTMGHLCIARKFAKRSKVYQNKTGKVCIRVEYFFLS